MLLILAIIWLVIWAMVMVDILRHPALRTGAKAAWALVVLILPLIGLIAYLIARPANVRDSNVGGRFGDAPDTSLPEERLRGEHPV